MPLAVMANELGPVSNYALRETPSIPLAAGQVRVALRAAGISYVDVLMAEGGYQVRPPVPFCPGSEGSGVVSEIAADVSGVAVGDAVVCSSWGGLLAEEIVLPAASVQPMPAGMSFETAAVLPVSYVTAWHALVDRGQVRAGETVLVLGAGGATGYAAIQVAKHLGARVIASAGSPDKRALALAGGADAVVDAKGDDWRGAVKVANGGKGVDVVFDPVGGEATEAAFRSLGWNGRHLVIGFPGGIPALRTNLALLKGASLIGVDIRQFGVFEPEKSAANRQQVFALASTGAFVPAIARAWPLADYAEAMEAAKSGRLAGRVVVTTT